MNSPQYLPKVGSGFLPPDAARRLKEAATNNPSLDPMERLRAINEADAWVKATYPQYFRKDI